MQHGREHFVIFTVGTKLPFGYKTVFVGEILCKVKCDPLSPFCWEKFIGKGVTCLSRGRIIESSYSNPLGRVMSRDRGLGWGWWWFQHVSRKFHPKMSSINATKPQRFGMRDFCWWLGGDNEEKSMFLLGFMWDIPQNIMNKLKFKMQRKQKVTFSGIFKTAWVRSDGPVSPTSQEARRLRIDISGLHEKILN